MPRSCALSVSLLLRASASSISSRRSGSSPRPKVCKQAIEPGRLLVGLALLLDGKVVFGGGGVAHGDTSAVRTSLLGVRIGDPERGERGSLDRLHPLGLGVLDVIEADEMQHAVHHEMRDVIVKRDALRARFLERGLVSEHDVAEKPRLL